MDGLEKKNAEDMAKWLLGLVFSAGIATFQNLRSKREQQKVFRAQVQEMHDVVKGQPAGEGPALPDGEASPATDDLRTIIERMQQQLTDHQDRTDERHAANIARFTQIEATQQRVGEDLTDLRKYLRDNRGETRKMMKRILFKVSELAPAKETEKK